MPPFRVKQNKSVYSPRPTPNAGKGGTCHDHGFTWELAWTLRPQEVGAFVGLETPDGKFQSPRISLFMMSELSRRRGELTMC